MCEICRKTPCDPRCPNAPEPEAVLICDECGGEIYEGNKYLDTINGPVCKECLENFSVEELLEITGESLVTA